MSGRCESTGLDPLEENQESGSDGGGQYRGNVAILPDLQESRSCLYLRSGQHRG